MKVINQHAIELHLNAVEAQSLYYALRSVKDNSFDPRDTEMRERFMQALSVVMEPPEIREV